MDVHLLAPVRPEELMLADRPAGLSEGIVLELLSAECLSITFIPVKSHAGKYGTQQTNIRLNPTIVGDAALFLADRCRAKGGKIVVHTKSKNAVRMAIAKLGSKALPEIGEIAITPYVIRHQVIANLEATFGAGALVAIAAGHSSDRTQSSYGDRKYGRKLRGYTSFNAKRPPRCGNTDRTRGLAKIQNPQAEPILKSAVVKNNRDS